MHLEFEKGVQTDHSLDKNGLPSIETRIDPPTPVSPSILTPIMAVSPSLSWGQWVESAEYRFRVNTALGPNVQSRYVREAPLPEQALGRASRCPA